MRKNLRMVDPLQKTIDLLIHLKKGKATAFFLEIHGNDNFKAIRGTFFFIKKECF